MVPNRQSGFTLIELLLYTGLLALMFSSITAFYFLFIDVRTRNSIRLGVEYEGMSALQYLTDTIRSSESIASPLSSSTAAELHVVMYDDSLGERRIYLDSTTLMGEDVLTQETYPLTSSRVSVSELSFQHVADGAAHDSIVVTLSISALNTSGRSAYDYSNTFTTTVTRR